MARIKKNRQSHPRCQSLFTSTLVNLPPHLREVGKTFSMFSTRTRRFGSGENDLLALSLPLSLSPSLLRVFQRKCRDLKGICRIPKSVTRRCWDDCSSSVLSSPLFLSLSLSPSLPLSASLLRMKFEDGREGCRHCAVALPQFQPVWTPPSQ